MSQAGFSVIQRGAKAAIMVTGALLALIVLWRVVAIIVTDIASYAWRH
jgi:hypothetical protein